MKGSWSLHGSQNPKVGGMLHFQGFISLFKDILPKSQLLSAWPHSLKVLPLPAEAQAGKEGLTQTFQDPSKL